MLEADAILLAEYHIKEKKIDVKAIQQPRSYDKDMIRMGQLFVRTTGIIWDSLVACGLSKAIVRNSPKQIQ